MPSRPPLSGVWAADTKGVVADSAASTNTIEALRSAPAPSSPSALDMFAAAAVDEAAAPYDIPPDALEALAAMAYLVGSPLQRQQLTGSAAAVHPTLLVAARLLQHGVDPERIIQLVECRYDTALSR